MALQRTILTGPDDGVVPPTPTTGLLPFLFATLYSGLPVSTFTLGLGPGLPVTGLTSSCSLRRHANKHMMSKCCHYLPSRKSSYSHSHCNQWPAAMHAAPFCRVSLHDETQP